MGSMRSALERALPIVAAAYGQQFGVKVILSGSDAYTDGQSIVLPMLSDMRGMSDVLFGYLAHEAAHIRDSNFGVIGLCTSAIEKSFLNIIEDIRIEGMMQELFPGAVETLTAMHEYVLDSNMSPPAMAEDNEGTQLHQYLLHRLYSEFLGREAEREYFEASDLVVRETFPEGFFTRLDVLLNKYMPKLKDSRDCLMLARRILQSLSDAEEEERQNREQAQNQKSQQPDTDADADANPDGSSDSDDDAGDDSDGGSGDGTDDADGTGDSGDSNTTGGNDSGDAAVQDDAQGNQGNESSQDANSGDSSSSQDSDENPDGSSATGGDGASAHSRVMEESDLPEDLVSALRGELTEKAADDNVECGSFTLHSDSVGDNTQNTGDISSLHEGILSSSVIRARLIGLLQAQSRQKEFLDRRGQRVDGSRLAKLLTGDLRVFSNREETKRVDTAVHVLLDASGSMQNIQEIANQAAVSLALAVSSIPQCDIAVSMFPGKGGAVSPMICRGQPVRVNLGRCAVRSSGGTPLAEAMLYGARELATCRRERKVMIVITDGAPNEGGSVKYMLKLIEPHVDVYAIGINSTAVSNYFKKHSVINSVAELQAALFSIAGRFLDLH